LFGPSRARVALQADEKVAAKIAKPVARNAKADEEAAAREAKVALDAAAKNMGGEVVGDGGMIPLGSKVRVLRPESDKFQETGTVVALDEFHDAATMLHLMDKWVLDEAISKPYEDDETEDACMVPIEIDWLNEKLCTLEECPITLKDDFDAVWEAVSNDGEGCVTVRRLKDRIAANVVVRFDDAEGLKYNFALNELEVVEALPEESGEAAKDD